MADQQRIQVVVVDLSGAALPGANVQVVPQRGGETREAKTDRTGGVVFDGTPGTIYRVEATSAGFEATRATFIARDPATKVCLTLRVASTMPFASELAPLPALDKFDPQRDDHWNAAAARVPGKESAFEVAYWLVQREDQLRLAQANVADLQERLAAQLAAEEQA